MRIDLKSHKVLRIKMKILGHRQLIVGLKKKIIWFRVNLNKGNTLSQLLHKIDNKQLLKAITKIKVVEDLLVHPLIILAKVHHPLFSNHMLRLGNNQKKDNRKTKRFSSLNY